VVGVVVLVGVEVLIGVAVVVDGTLVGDVGTGVIVCGTSGFGVAETGVGTWF
jgi:hypothetical protein